MTDEPILERRYEPMASKPVGTGFHTFTLDDVKEKMQRQLFEMKCVSFDRNDIDRHFQKISKIYFEIGGDINLKQAFVSSLPKLLASRTMTITEERFLSITIPKIGYIKQAIFVALDDICTKRSAQKQIIQHNPVLDKACRKSDLITGSGCSCHTSRRRREFRRFRLPRIPDGKSRFVKLLEEIEDYTGIRLGKEEDLESIFSVDDEPNEETLFSLDIYEDQGNDQYQISEPDFMKKGKHPLLKNEEFFIKIPFKKNENINLTKASHSGMNPDHLQLAKKECEELLEFDLTEPSDSQWACEAFYVNKRAEQTR
ncbi:uncharacterized protein [Nicotiana sylvestris]|uniref:uncharacterized protein n=1 Tax=Nicotiana sylvestris TaxID=4096 RepID=UPI00388CE577